MPFPKTAAQRHFFCLKLFLILFLFQNCTVYRGSSVNIETAVKEDTKVVVRTKSGERIKFKKLLEENENIVGLAKKQKTIEYLEKQGLDYKKYGKYRGYIIDSLQIDSIYPKNKPVSTLVTVVASLLSAVTLLTITAVAILFSTW